MSGQQAGAAGGAGWRGAKGLSKEHALFGEALQALESAAHKFPAGSEVLLREPPVATLMPARWYLGDIRHEAYQRLDKYHRERLSYRIFERLVQFCGGVDRNASYVLALILLAVLAKIITMPMTAAQFKSMRALQAVQPELRKLQEKLKGDLFFIRNEAYRLRNLAGRYEERGLPPKGSIPPKSDGSKSTGKTGSKGN